MTASYFLILTTPSTTYWPTYPLHSYWRIRSMSKTQLGLIDSVLQDLNLMQDSKVKDTLLSASCILIRWHSQTRHLELPVHHWQTKLHHTEHPSWFELCSASMCPQTGYIITYCCCPIHWASKLQSEIALSTTKSEYITLLMVSRELLPICHLDIELHEHGLFSTPLSKPFSITHTSTLEATTIYEGNASCVLLAHRDSNKVQTKHISLKWHRFKDHLCNGDLKVVKIDSAHNWANIFTKPLRKVKHEACATLSWAGNYHPSDILFSLRDLSFSHYISSYEGGK